ncbi:MAG: lipoprotein signal peptidase, partial [Clostridiales bacterium]|nr:lipoprotein signal peptidase [Clostridiales bacterium]
LPQVKRYNILRILLVLIIAGAIGNLIDRIRLNYVVDFIYFALINFPIFNVADIYVTVSTFVFLILALFYYKDEDFEFLEK